VNGTTTLSFAERYDELHEIGIPDWQIAKRMGITALSLVRMLLREGKPVSPLLAEIAAEEREKAAAS